MSWGNGQFESNFQWLLEIGDWLDVMVNVFLVEVKKAGGIRAKILVSWDVCMYEVGQEVTVASLLLSLKDHRLDP